MKGVFIRVYEVQGSHPGVDTGGLTGAMAPLDFGPKKRYVPLQQALSGRPPPSLAYIGVMAVPHEREEIRTKCVKGVPIQLSCFLTLGAVIWFVYGLVIRDLFVAIL
ncbi:Bidirectional sugar transporter [Nymphaea thermarum]|nr:Bidirectional sugar transporter [Nymphaea thermarum]